MPSLNTLFDELIERIRRGRDIGHVCFEPIYYLVFAPSGILEIKRSLPAWTARLRNEGWDVHVFSIAEHVDAILKDARPRRIWLLEDRKTPQAWERTNSALANALSQGALQDRVEQKMEELQGNPNALMIVSDIEALHPYMRIGTIESNLCGKFQVPTIFFYPGERTGKIRLKFMGFYPEDGNYRSVHVGG